MPPQQNAQQDGRDDQPDDGTPATRFDVCRHPQA
jgi:hypothetical protein